MAARTILPCYHFITPVLSPRLQPPSGDSGARAPTHKCRGLIAQARDAAPCLTPRLGWVAC
eukprot:scaffold81199_cov31-Phaeocystis_antarctica.AAC.1